ncbi:MAG: helix-turn-helix domain-containing protein [Muribaculaceae bacterium]
MRDTTTLHKQILDLLHKIQTRLENPQIDEASGRVYDNKSLMELLGIKDRYLKRLRDNGLLGYSRHGDKYWYTQSDIDRFLSRCHYAPFADMQ